MKKAGAEGIPPSAPGHIGGFPPYFWFFLAAMAARASFRDIVQHEPYPVESKAREILQRLKAGGVMTFHFLFRGNRSRSEVVATFLAVLELCKARVLRLTGSETDCTVRQEGTVPENLTI